MHEYKITASSLYAAASIGMKARDIIAILDKLSKVTLPAEIKEGS